MLLHLTEYSEVPLEHQIARGLAEMLLRSPDPGGGPLASERTVAREHRVSVETVRRAYRRLESLGLIERRAFDRCFAASLDPERRSAIVRRLFPRRADTAPPEPADSARHRRWRQDVAAARRIQSELLPTELPRLAGVWIAADARPSEDLGGDFYDCIRIDKNRFAVVIGDAAGKSVPAALLASQVQSWLKSELESGGDLHGILGKLNDQLVRSTPSNRYVTLCCGILSLDSGELRYANAGHARPILVDRRGRIRFLDISGPPLGMIENPGFATSGVVLDDRDTLVLFSDGVTETVDGGGEQFGADRVARAVVNGRHLTPEGLIATVLDQLERFSRGAPPPDDRTLMVLRRGPVGPGGAGAGRALQTSTA